MRNSAVAQQWLPREVPKVRLLRNSWASFCDVSSSLGCSELLPRLSQGSLAHSVPVTGTDQSLTGSQGLGTAQLLGEKNKLPKTSSFLPSLFFALNGPGPGAPVRTGAPAHTGRSVPFKPERVSRSNRTGAPVPPPPPASPAPQAGPSLAEERAPPSPPPLAGAVVGLPASPPL